MTTKTFYVANALQAALMNQVFIREFTDGFWKGQRPAGHGEVWKDVEIKVTEDGTLGPVGFTPARMYNLLNPEFIKASTDALIEAGKAIKEDITIQKIKSELPELSRIIGQRMTKIDEAPIKLWRGRGANATPSAKAREASAKLVDAANQPVAKPEKGAKRTVTKAANGVTTTRVEVTSVPASAFPFATAEATETAIVSEETTSETSAE